MQRANGAEVAGVQGDHQLRAEALGERHDRRFGPTERAVGVLLDKVGNPSPVRGSRRLDVEIAKTPKERGLGSQSEPAAEMERHLGDDQCGDNEVQIARLQHVRRPMVDGLRSVRGGNERPRINDRQQPPSLPR